MPLSEQLKRQLAKERMQEFVWKCAIFHPAVIPAVAAQRVVCASAKARLNLRAGFARRRDLQHDVRPQQQENFGLAGVP